MLNTMRIATDAITRRPLKEAYWEWRVTADKAARLLQGANGLFAKVVARDCLRFLFNTVQPIAGETRERARGAAGWLVRAQDATPDDGVTFGFFPCNAPPGWGASYPETTGYCIPSLLRFAELDGNEDYRKRALRMARWEVAIQMPSGAVQGGQVCAAAQQTPSTFNTGMVLDGWSAAFRASGEIEFLDAGRRAAEFLICDLTPEGYFRTNGAFVTQTGIKTYNALCAWSLYRIGEDAADERYRDAAIRIIDAAIKQQRANGWFANNCLTRSEAPLTHTISYTLQGVLEVGILCGRHDFIEAVRKGVSPLLSMIAKNGFLPGRFYSDWEPASFSSCLTGSAQLAVVCYRLFEQTGSNDYRVAAESLVNFLKGLQSLGSPIEEINGALAGSFPIFGTYMTGGYPNWATKYFLDALMLQERCALPANLERIGSLK